MLPGDGSLVSPSISGPFLWKMRSPNDLLTDYERGGSALNASGSSLDVQTWTFGYDAPDVWVEDEANVRTVLFSKPDITELGGAFDQNMNPFVTYVDGSGAHYWWYDTTLSQQVFSDLPDGSVNPRCCIDDHRIVFSTSIDIILAYTRGNSLYYRQQRDRYGTEYNRASLDNKQLASVGMSTVNRLQFMIVNK